LSCLRFQYHLPSPINFPRFYGTRYDAVAVIFKVYTDQGIVGLGEADPLNPFTEETPASVMVVTRDVIAPNLLNQNALDMAGLEYRLDRAVNGNLTARGAVNMALFDIAGKANNIPAHLMLGGRVCDNLTIFRGIESGTAQEDAIAIEQEMEKGFHRIMIKMGASNISDEIKCMISAMDRFGDRIRFIVDANQGWDVTEALTFVERTKDYSPELIEQPIHRRNIEGLKRIKDRCCCCLLSADESLVTIDDATALIQKQAVDVFSLKVSKNGGLKKTKEIAVVAEAFGIKCLMNSMLEFGITQAASLQVGCTLTNLVDFGYAYGSVRRMSDDVTDFGQNISGG